MAMKWAEVIQTPDYQQADSGTREAMRNGYFMDVVAPQIPTEHLEAAKSSFDEDTQSSLASRAGEAISGGVSAVSDIVSKGISFAGEVYDDAQKREASRVKQEEFTRSNAARPTSDIGSFVTPLENKINQRNEEATRKYESSPVAAVSEVVRQGYAGATIDAPAAVNKAGQAFSPDGSAAEDFFRSGAEYWESNKAEFEPNNRNKGAITKAFAGGARALPLSGTAMAASGAALLTSSVAAPIATAAGIVALFGGSTFTDTYEKAIQAGLPKEEAFKAGLLTGGIEGVGETVGDFVGGKFLTGLGKAFAKKLGTKEALAAATSPKWAAEFGKSFLQNAAVQSGTEFAQGFGQTAVENRYGISDESPIHVGKEGAITALAMSGLMAPGAVIGHTQQAKARKMAGDLLEDGSAPIAERAKAAEFVRQQMIPHIGEKAAKEWHEGMVAQLGFDQAAAIKKGATQTNAPDTGDLNAATILGTPEPEQPAPVAKPAGVLSRAALAAVQQGITPLNQPEVNNAQVQPGAANEQPNIGPAGANTNVLLPIPGNGGGNAGAGNGNDAVGVRVAATSTGESGGAAGANAGLPATQQADTVTAEEVAAVQDIPTTEKISMAIAAVGEDQFKALAQAKIQKYRPANADQEAMLVEAAAIEIIAKNNRTFSFSDPHELRTNEFVKKAVEHGVSPEVAAKIAPPHIPENVTGFYKAEDKDPTVARAQEFVAQTGKQAHFVDADIANLGGLNAHFKNNHAPANAVYRAFSDIFHEELQKLGAKVIPFRHGGDEFSAVVLGSTAEAIRKATDAASARIKDYAISQGLDKIEHPKHPGSLQHQGVGVYFGQAEIRPGVHLKQIFAESAASIDAGKTGGLYVSREQGSPQADSGEAQGGRSRVSKGDAGVRSGADAENRGVQRAEQPAAQGTKSPAGDRPQGGAGENADGNSADARGGRVQQGDGVSEELQRALESLIRSRKTAGQFGLAPNLDAVIRATKAYLKGEKFNKSLFNKTANKFQRHDAGIATTIRGIIDTVSQGKKAGPKVSKPSNDLIQRIKQLGGISSEYAEDFGAKDAKFYVKSAFKKGGESPDFVARQLKDEGYPLSEDDLIGGLSEFVRRYIAGERSFKHVDTEAAAMSEHDDRAFMELVPDAEKYGINWREFKSPDDLYIAIDNAKFALSDAEEAARDIVLGDSDITLDDAKQSTAAEVDTWLQGDNNARGHTESAAGTATREQVKSDAVGTQNTDGTQEQARPSLELKGQTNAEIAKQEAAKAKAEAEKEAPAKNVTADQADMFSTQNTLFNSNRDGTQVAPIVVENHADLKQAEKQVNTNPSDAQKESGNYAKGHIQWNGLDITIENPAGSERTGTDADGEKWSVTMPATYGYIRSFKPVGSDQSLPQSTITAPDLFGNKTNAFTGANQAINFGPIIENLVAGISTINSSIPKSFSQRTLGDIKSLGDSSTINSFREQLKSLVNIPSDKPSGSIDSLILQAARDGVATDTYIFGNSGNAEAIRSKGFNSLNIETQRMVQNHMLSIFQDGEIRKSIVQLIPINMVDMLVHEKFSANNRLDNKAMLLERLSASSTFDDPIFVGRIIDTIASNLPVAFASRIAKEMHGAGNFAGVTFNALATKITGYSDSHNSPSKSLKSYYSTKGADGDHIDVYIGKHHNSDKVFIVDQNDHKNGNFDEHKVMLGFDTLREAERTYKAGFSDGKGAARMGKVSVMSLDEFKAWLAEGDTTKPAADITPPAEKNALADALEKYDDSGEIQTVDDLANEVERLIDEGQAPASLKSAIDDYHDAQDENHEMAGRGDMDTAEEEFISAIKSAINPVKKSTERTKLDNATAPEHVSSAEDDGAGVSVQELKQISAAFRSHINSGGDSDVTHIFDDPKKSEIVRLNDKAKIYKEGNGWMTPAEAKAEIATWKENARKQGKNETSRNANSQKVVLSLFDLSGEWSKPWVEAGYQVYRFDIQDDPTVGDINNFSTGFFNDWFGDFEGMDIHAILAACPCTDFAVSGARHFAAKDADGRTVSSVRLVKGTLAAIEYFKPAVWALENPVGRIEGLTGLPNWRLSFDPNHLGDTYTKKTLIWGRFNADLPVAPVDPVEGSKMHTQYGGKSMATKNARSVTPEGFAYGFFQANNIIDNPVMAVANKFDRLDRSLMQKAVDAGITVEEINDAVEDFYYMDLDDDAANAAIQELISAAKPPPAKAKIAAGNIITDAEIPKGLKLKISKKLVDAKKAMAAANQRVAKLEALKGCMA